MKITIIGVLVALAGFFAILKIILDLKKENIGYRSGLIWMTIWGGVCVVGIFPDFLNYAMEITQLHHRTFFAIILAVFVLYALIFNQAFKMDSMSRDIRKLVREIALLNYKLEEQDQQGADQHQTQGRMSGNR